MSANPPILQNILDQTDALRAVGSHQFGEGRGALTAVSGLLRSSRRIILTGMGGSFAACIPLSYFFAARGVPVSVIETSELLYFHTSTFDAETAVVLVSRSGESVEATKLLPILKKSHCRVAGVTNVPGSTLASQADEIILLGSPPDELVAIQTYSATVVALLLLGSAYFNELDTVKPELDATIGVLSRWIPECFRRSAGWTEFFSQPTPLYLLGRGASLASATLGALLSHEVAKRPAVSMSAAQFRHGPVEVAGEQFRAVVFSSEPATAELDAALATDLLKTKSSVRWIGPQRTHSNVEPLCPWPDGVPDRFAPVLEIVPLQFAAFHLAQSRGIPLGQFRFAPAITLSETGFDASIPG